jgi:hypothetical protein
MSDPKPWMEEGPPEAVGRLLEAASAERPPEASLSRALTALGLGASATGAATTAGAATAGASTAAGTTMTGAAGVVSAGKATSVVVTGALVKWGLVGGALVAASVAGTAVVRRGAVLGAAERPHLAVAVRDATTRAVARSSASGSPKAAEASPNAAEASPNAATGASPSPSVATASATTPSVVSRPSVRAAHKALLASAATASEPTSPLDAERLAEEVALVDRARGALARGDAQGTLKALDDYDAHFSPRKFAPEALYLRMEALLRLGQTSAARAVADRLATNYPSSPNAARARQVLGTSIP